MNKRKARLSVDAVRKILSAEDYSEAKGKIENAEKTLEEVRDVLSSALFLRNGKLTTGHIDYAAFRIETLSLIFETARDTFFRFGGEGQRLYDQFLHNLGDEVGFSFARDLIGKLRLKNLFLDMHDARNLITLWASYENDTGAGITKLKKYSKNKIIIEISRNPLRRRESNPHAHCAFYAYYIKSFLNELLSLRSRLIQKEIEGTKVQTMIVHKIEEIPDIDDNCVFICALKPEKMTRAFDALDEAFEIYNSIADGDDFSPCASQARAAMVIAQMELLDWHEERLPPKFVKVFKGVISSDAYKRMDDVYQISSRYIHKESRESKRLNKDRCFAILRDIRRSIYEMELLPLSNEQRIEMKNFVRMTDMSFKIDEILLAESDLPEPVRKEVKSLFKKLSKGKLREERFQEKLVAALIRVGGSAWEIAMPVLSDVLVASIKKKYGLE